MGFPRYSVEVCNVTTAADSWVSCVRLLSHTSLRVQVKQEEEATSTKMSTSTGGKYVPPFMKEGAKTGGVSMANARGRGEVGNMWRGKVARAGRLVDLPSGCDLSI